MISDAVVVGAVENAPQIWNFQEHIKFQGACLLNDSIQQMIILNTTVSLVKLC